MSGGTGDDEVVAVGTRTTGSGSSVTIDWLMMTGQTDMNAAILGASNPFPWMSDEYVAFETDRASAYFEENGRLMTQEELDASNAEAAELYRLRGNQFMAAGALVSRAHAGAGASIAALGGFFYLSGEILEP